VVAYAFVGSVPAYVEGFNPNLSLAGNIRDVILAPGSMFVLEPAFLLYDDVRERSTHMAILTALEGRFAWPAAAGDVIEPRSQRLLPTPRRPGETADLSSGRIATWGCDPGRVWKCQNRAG
jgi:hypothetical protein